MSSHVVVISTDLRRTTVKVTPGTYLSDVLDQACKKLNLDANKHAVKHKQKTVDLSIPFRTSGLVSGAKLELVLKANTPSAVQIALQIPQPEAREIPGGRLIKKFPSDLPIWQILRQFESGDASAGKNVNITARGVAETLNAGNAGLGQLYYETPVLNIMGRELSTLVDFQKTMSQLGHNSGSVLIRLSFRKTDQTLYDAMAQIGQYFKDEEGQGKEEAAPADESPQEEPSEPPPTEASSITLSDDTVEPQGEQEQGRHVTEAARYEPLSVFLAPEGSTPAAALAPFQENDFTPTIAHAQLHQQRLQQSSRNKRLLSDREIEDKEAAEQAKIAAVKSVLVKIRFPDNTSSEWQVGPSETGSFLYAAVRHIMAHADQPFHLVVPGSKTVIKDDDGERHELVQAYRFSGRVLVSLVWDDGASAEARGQPFLKADVASQAQVYQVRDVSRVEGDAEQPVAPKPSAAKKDEGDGTRKVPKWFKLGKK